ncbi:phosphotransferase [Saccharospirillum salsuginis]|uniref:Aminoglycoside phosphotransferase domain-containing protein n=1 Tax=Saccharospirillum salsuginis TaxID=418750 RepID=A0A918K296_9GAMM|nr:phosphotransferase [Saccharospirillum salsuginis]GGX39431.1 hypothetical protein GCM10007392_02250 [Saccharospirillum salsuginis]
MSLPLFQALDRLDDHLKDPVRIQRWAGGACNRVFRLTDAERTLALRLNRADTDRLGVVRRRETDILKTVQGRPWAPEVVAIDDDGLLTAWVEGQSPASGDKTDLDWLVQALTEVHAETPDVGVLNMAEQIRHLMEQGPPLESAIAQALHRHCDAYRLPASLTLCHHDWHPGNIVTTRRGWVLLDWEFAALGDPVMDVAAACQGFELDAAQIEHLAGRLTLDEDRLRQALCLMEAVALVWYRANPESAQQADASADAWFQRWSDVRF